MELKNNTRAEAESNSNKSPSDGLGCGWKIIVVVLDILALLLWLPSLCSKSEPVRPPVFGSVPASAPKPKPVQPVEPPAGLNRD